MADSVFFHEGIEKVDMGKGVIRQDFAKGKNMNVLHWNMADKSVVGLHTHPQEQFGLCIKGGFLLTIGEETYTLKAGDAYLVPANIPHSFVAVGDTEAIDVFAPIKSEFPWDK